MRINLISSADQEGGVCVVIDEQARESLTHKRIAVAGISRSGASAANVILIKLRDPGHDVYPVNPNGTELEGMACYRDIPSIPGGVDGVVTVTTPQVTEEIVHQCAAKGVRRMWIHRAMGSSLSEKTVEMCRESGIEVGCPMMFQAPVDIGHRCMKWWFRLTGALPS